MAIVVVCPKCGKKYSVADQYAGRKGKCNCGCHFQLPCAVQATPSVDASAAFTERPQVVIVPSKTGVRGPAVPRAREPPLQPAAPAPAPPRGEAIQAGELQKHSDARPSNAPAPVQGEIVKEQIIEAELAAEPAGSAPAAPVAGTVPVGMRGLPRPSSGAGSIMASFVAKAAIAKWCEEAANMWGNGLSARNFSDDQRRVAERLGRMVVTGEDASTLTGWDRVWVVTDAELANARNNSKTGDVLLDRAWQARAADLERACSDTDIDRITSTEAGTFQARFLAEAAVAKWCAETVRMWGNSNSLSEIFSDEQRRVAERLGRKLVAAAEAEKLSGRDRAAVVTEEELTLSRSRSKTGDVLLDRAWQARAADLANMLTAAEADKVIATQAGTFKSRFLAEAVSARGESFVAEVVEAEIVSEPNAETIKAEIREAELVPGPADGVPARPEAEYREKDNMGTRHDTFDQASAWWMANLVKPKGSFLVYTFASGEDARAALLDVNCMHEVKTTGKIVCTETLMYGFYQRTDGVWEAEIVGKDFSYELWIAAKEAFCRHGGKRKSEKAPEKTEETTMPKTIPAPDKVTFVREDHKKSHFGSMMTYRIHSAPSAEAAKQFLQGNPVDKPLFYIVVETPEGNYCRDKDGIYKE